MNIDFKKCNLPCMQVTASLVDWMVTAAGTMVIMGAGRSVSLS